MYLSSSVITIPVLVSLAAAVPTSQEGLSFTLDEVASNVDIAPAHQLAARLARNTKLDFSRTELMAKALRKVNVTAENYDNIGYIVPLTIGNQTFRLGVDTGESDLVVYSILEPAAERANPNHTYYTPGSTAKKMKGLAWNITYPGSASLSGVVYADKVKLGQATAIRQAVEAATSTVNFAANDAIPVDGSIGMGFRRGSGITPKARRPATFWETLSPLLAKPLFTSRVHVNQPGSYDFGFIDHSKYKGDISYVKINANGTKHGAWEFNAGSYSIANKRSTTELGNTLVDSGNPFVILPDELVVKYYAKIANATLSPAFGWTLPCTAQPPKLHVEAGAKTFDIGGQNVIMFNVDVTHCLGALQSREDLGLSYNVFGNPFLRTAFMVFDSSGPRIGFAQQS